MEAGGVSYNKQRRTRPDILANAGEKPESMKGLGRCCDYAGRRWWRLQKTESAMVRLTGTGFVADSIAGAVDDHPRSGTDYG